MNTLLRFITGIILVPIVFYCLLRGGLEFLLLASGVFILAVFECLWMVFGRLSGFGNLCGLLFALGIPMYVFYFSAFVEYQYALFALFLIFSLYVVNDRSISKSQFEKLAVLFSVSIYLIIGLCAAVWLRLGIEGIPMGMSWILLGMISVWLNDSGAFFAGKWFGKHPFYPSITKKTWEGFLGGTLATLTLPFVIRAWLDSMGSKWSWGFETSDLFWILIPVCFLAPLGDLMESKFKRLYGVKDSSKLLPGHGGILDRIDSLLLVMPWVYVYVTLLRGMIS